jgi:hypothetical protein
MPSQKYYKSDNRKEFYRSRIVSQQGACAVCGEKARLVIDHDHVTGMMRGLLCYKHNTALGLFDDSPQMLQNAIEYLKLHQPIEYKRDVKITNKYLAYLAGQELIEKLLDDFSFPSDRARARVVAKVTGGKESTAQTWIVRARKKRNSLKQANVGP